jgi:hypothetical protein
MMGNNFGLFGSFRKAKILLRKLLRIMSPDALIIAVTTDPYQTKNPIHQRYQRLNRSRGRMPGQLRIRIRHATVIGPGLITSWLQKQRSSRLSTARDGA